MLHIALVHFIVYFNLWYECAIIYLSMLGLIHICNIVLNREWRSRIITFE